MDPNLSIPLEVSAMMAHEEESTVSFALKIFSMVLMAITFVLGIVGNGFVIWVVVFRMHRTVTTVCYQNLALADFSLSATMPFIIASMATKSYFLTIILCQFVYIVIYLNLFSSVFFIVFIALDRCICVLHPVWAQNHRTVKLAKKLLWGPWILAFILTVPVMIFLTVKEDSYGNPICFFRFSPITKLIALIRLILGFSLPMFTIAICYILIAAKIYRVNTIGSNHSLWLLTAVVACFFICFFPFQLVKLLNIIGIRKRLTDDRNKILDLLAQPTIALSFFNSCLNPIVYVFMGRDFRENLIHSLPVSLEKALREDPESPTKSKL